MNLISYKKRDKLGRNATKKIRCSGYIPATIIKHASHIEVEHIMISHKDFVHHYRAGDRYVKLTSDNGQTLDLLVQNIETHFLKDTIVHIVLARN